MTDRSGRKPKVPGTIRLYSPHDREAVREICCRTAFRNAGCEKMFEDRELHADYWTRYYTDFTPEQTWVVEEEGRVIGYFFGCTNTRAYTRAMALRIVPPMVVRALWRLATGRYKKPETRAYLWHMLRHGASEAPEVDFTRYPAHFHCNVLRQGIGKGYYTSLVLAFLDRLETQGIERLHGFLTEEAEGSAWHKVGRAFMEAHPQIRFETVSEKPTRLFQAVLGLQTPMVNRGWGMRVADYRRYVQFLRDGYRL
jgi:hypothetical protein